MYMWVGTIIVSTRIEMATGTIAHLGTIDHALATWTTPIHRKMLAALAEQQTVLDTNVQLSPADITRLQLAIANARKVITADEQFDGFWRYHVARLSHQNAELEFELHNAYRRATGALTGAASSLDHNENDARVMKLVITFYRNVSDFLKSHPRLIYNFKGDTQGGQDRNDYNGIVRSFRDNLGLLELEYPETTWSDFTQTEVGHVMTAFPYFNPS